MPWILGPLAALAVSYVLLFTSDLLPSHDTLANLFWYHYFLSALREAPTTAPVWNPFMTWGSPTHLHWAVGLSPSMLLLTPLGVMFSSLSATTLFYASLLLDEFLLLGGVYLLSGLLFRRETARAFVCLSMVGTVVWSSQIYWNFRLYYLLPLALYFLLRAARERSWISAGAAFTILLAASFVGNILYVAAVLFLLGTFFFLAFRWTEDKTGASSPVGKSLLYLFPLLLVTSLGLLFYDGPPYLVASGRDAAGMVSRDQFLGYEMYSDLRYFGGFLHGLELPLDVSTFGGLLVAPLALYAIFFCWKRALVPWIGASLFVFLLWLGKDSFVAPLAYLLPGFSRYRYLGLVTPLIKVFVVIIAGFGLEHWLARLERKSARAPLWTAAGFILVSGLALALTTDLRTPRALFTLLILIGYAALFWGALLHRRTLARYGSVMLLALLFAEVVSYRESAIESKSLSLSPLLRERLQARPWALDEKRTVAYREHPLYQMMLGETKGNIGAAHNITDWFLGIDSCFSPFKMDDATQRAARFREAIGLPASLDPSFFTAMGCESPKWRWVSSPRIVSSLAHGIAMLRLNPASVFLLANETDSISLMQGEIPTREPKLVHSSPSSITLSTDGEGGWLYLAQSWHERWKAQAGGADLKILPGNSAFQLIAIPPGMKEIELRYDSPLMNFIWWMQWATGAGIAALLLSFVGNQLLRSKRIRIPSKVRSGSHSVATLSRS